MTINFLKFVPKNLKKLIKKCHGEFLYLLEKQVKKRYPHDYISPPKKGQPIVKFRRRLEMFGFKLWDKISCSHSKLGDVVGYIQGRRSSGSFAIASLDGELLIGGVFYKKLKLLQSATSNYIRERKDGNSSLL